MKLYIEPPEDEQIRPGEIHLHIRFRPANMLGILLVVLMHALLLYYLLHLKTHKKEGDTESPQSPIVLMFDAPKAATAARAEPKKAQSKPVLSKPVSQPKRITPLIAEAATPLPPPDSTAPQGMDMSSMLNAARERRRMQEENAAQENQQAQQGSRGLSPQEVAEANVKRSMQQANGRQGTNGVFQIISKSTRTASFSFRGWNPGNANNSWRQVIEVDAGLGGDVDLAIIRRMIELIRTHYKGDFNWESQRLGRVINLSARPQDSAELERFMMKEFFGS
ncbi:MULTISPECIES: hypothetical protein [Undibacterium]|uniref:Uncharacterized protein n=1 Tax=Undibacterium parvum TaxID=401471 RepID=A0A3S9HIM9_9BURK|nr:MULTISPECIES: hypothetical protein [Undibacterium]AZP11966.1 hypothetical protein EJN92_08080 [Undibacterium parvum]